MLCQGVARTRSIAGGLSAAKGEQKRKVNMENKKS